MTLPAFLRLMLMSFLLMSACVVLFSLYIWVTVKEKLSPNLSFRVIHSHFGVIPLIPKLVLTPFQIKWLYGLLWVPPISTILVFGLFTINREVAKDCGLLLSWLSGSFLPKLSSLWYVIDTYPSHFLTLHSKLQEGQNLALINSTKSALSHQDKKGAFISPISYITRESGSDETFSCLCWTYSHPYTKLL
jgi:hypothetical protein